MQVGWTKFNIFNKIVSKTFWAKIRIKKCSAQKKVKITYKNLDSSEILKILGRIWKDPKSFRVLRAYRKNQITPSHRKAIMSLSRIQSLNTSQQGIIQTNLNLHLTLRHLQIIFFHRTISGKNLVQIKCKL